VIKRAKSIVDIESNEIPLGLLGTLAAFALADIPSEGRLILPNPVRKPRA
jgi:hypothetical protein